MHYILLTIALNLGKENIDKIDIKSIKEARKEEVANSNFVNSKTDNLPIANESLLDKKEEIPTPFIESEDFAELLPEKELNDLKNKEEQGPKFLQSIKEKLIEATEKDKKETVIGSQVEGPNFIEGIKDKITGKKQEEKGKIQAVKEIRKGDIAKDQKKSDVKVINNKIEDKIQDDSKLVSDMEFAHSKREKEEMKEQEKPGLFEKIKNKVVGVMGLGKKDKDKVLSTDTEKFTEDNIKKETKDLNNQKTEKVKIVGTLFDSELEQALKTGDYAEKDEDILKNSVDIEKELKDTYEENEEYKKFLVEKQDLELSEPERILIPKIIPREKNIISYKNKNIPQELLNSRSFQNRHIPKIIQDNDKELILEKIIEYGLIGEFRAFIKDLKNANLIMSNDYTLLTYATYKKQYKIMEYLIYKGADVNKRDEKLNTPLNIAVLNNDIIATKILIESNANPNIYDILKRTPLVYCIEKKQEYLGVYLIDHGANIDIENPVGENTLSMSMRLGRNIIKQKIINVLKSRNNKK